MSVSASRLTLLPLVFVGSRERATVPPWMVGGLPLRISPDRADSKSTRPARKPGVLTFEMLSAVTRCRGARPESAAGRAVEVASPIIEQVDDGCSRTRSTSGYADGPRKR